MSTESKTPGWFRSVYGWLEAQSLLLLPAVGLVVLFLLVPMSYLGIVSFYKFDPIQIVVHEFTAGNYAKIFQPFYRSFIIYTLKLAVTVTVLCLVLGYPVSYYIARAPPKKKQLMLFISVLPLMVGVVVRTYGWMIIFGSNGIVNKIWEPLFGHPLVILRSTPAVTLGLTGVLLPFLIFPVYSSIQDVGMSLERASRNLGANKLQTLYHVVVPLSLPGMVTGIIFCFTLSMSAIITPKLLGGRQDVTIGSLIYDLVLIDINWPLASAMAIIIAVINVALVYVYIRVSQGRVEMEAGE
jgi:ABC-type spermidine/putrescine transport system permease subunit I